MRVRWMWRSLGLSAENAADLQRFLWGVHAVVCVVFFALLPWRFFSHIVFAPLAWSQKTDRPLSSLRPVDLDAFAQNDNKVKHFCAGNHGECDDSRYRKTSELAEKAPKSCDSGYENASQRRQNGQAVPPAAAATSPGATAWFHFPASDLLQADACTTCGRCNSVCPAQAAEKPLRPRDIVLGIREAMNQPTRALSQFVTEDAIWSCTTCSACNQACPVGIEVYDKIVDLRRGLVEAGTVSTRSMAVFDNLFEQDNPFQKSSETRMSWAAGLELPVAARQEPIKLLYWIGCAGSFAPEGQQVSRAMVKILNHLKIRFHVLGKREPCNGDPARRLGEEGLYQELARATLEMLQEHGVSTILTHCPHCFNVFKNEYPQLADVSFRVEHHSQFLSGLIQSGRLTISGNLAQRVTFHDPCYLGRGNGDTQSPRQVLAALPAVESVEMPRNGCNSSCCGAGGGSIWTDVKGIDRIENQRAREAAHTGADLVVTGCPFCKTMLEAGRQSFENQLSETMDLAELIVVANGL